MDRILIQYSFYTPLTAIVKTFVMMVGEMDYSTIFLSHYTSTDYNDVLQYSVSSFCVFVVFVVVMGLLVSNLLVGLAVDDIASVQKEATLKRLALQVTGILDMEYGLPSFLQRRWLTRIHRTRPNKHNQRSFILRWLLTAGQESYSTPQKGELEALQEDVKQLKELISKLSKDVHKI